MDSLIKNLQQSHRLSRCKKYPSVRNARNNNRVAIKFYLFQMNKKISIKPKKEKKNGLRNQERV